jgi:hypothetical protein
MTDNARQSFPAISKQLRSPNGGIDHLAYVCRFYQGSGRCDEQMEYHYKATKSQQC